jgi:hypothetical protein
MTPDLQARIESLEAQLERLRVSATADLQSLQNDLLAKNRRIGQLEAELNQHSENSPEAGVAKELLVLWRDTIRGGRKNIDVSLDSDRGRAMLRALKTKGIRGASAEDRVRKAILGCQYDDWAMGRTAKQDRPYNDIAKHILKDSDRFEHFIELYDKHNVKPVQVVKPAPKPAPKAQLFSTVPPIDRVLAAIDPFDRKPAPNNPDQWYAKCPAHDDGDPSLSITRGVDGKVLLHCFAGCETDDVLRGLGLEWRDLWDGSDRDLNAEYHGGDRPPDRRRAALLRDIGAQVESWERRAA